MLSDIPPSTATTVRPSPSVRRSPTLYSVTAGFPTTLRPGSAASVGTGRPSSPHPTRRRSSAAAAMSAMEGVRSSVYVIANPPPMSSISTAMPWSRRRLSVSATKTSSSRMNGSTSGTCEPIWACTPRKRTFANEAAAATVAGAATAGTPNAVDSWPVAMDSCVSTRTPGFTLRRNGCTTPAAPANASKRRSSSRPSAIRSPTRTRIASSSSSSDLLRPWSAIRAGATPARTHASTSPPLAARRSSPSSAANLSIACAENAFTA